MDQKRTSRRETDELGRAKISKLLLKYAVPSVIAMMATSLYNLVDTIFIGQGVGAYAISGLAIAAPIMGLATAFSLLVGVGGAAMMSIRLGRGETQTAKSILGNVLLLNAITGVLFSAVALLFLDEILILFGASDNTLGYARDYTSIILYGNIISSIYLGLNSLLRSSGYPRKSMMIMLASIVVNCILDAILIFGLKWGVKGAAVATIAAQAIALGLEVKHYINRDHFIHFSREIFRLRWHIVKGIVAIGLSPFILNVCGSIVVVFINSAMLTYGSDLHVGAFGIINRYVYVFTMTVIGINQGVQPIIGYNFGAGRLLRMRKALYQSIFCGVIVTILGGITAQLFPSRIASLFTSDQELIRITAEGFRLVMIVFPLVGFQMVATSFFQSIEQAQKSVFLSITRQIVFLVPLLLTLPRYWGTDGVWLSMPIADGISILLTGALLAGQLHKLGIKKRRPYGA